MNSYETILPLIGTALPSWVGNTNDAARVAAYLKYEDMYWNTPETFALVQRGTDKPVIYIPSARIIVEATNRFLAKSWDFSVDPTVGTPNDQTLVSSMIRRLFKRELMWAKFATQKRYGLIRGDQVWHILANPLKKLGSRISINELDPGSYFPIHDPDNLERIIGCHLVDQVLMDDLKTIANRRQTYRKDPLTGGITTELALFELGKWDDRDPVQVKATPPKLLQQLIPVTPLDPRITTIPVYHIKNSRTPGDPFGSSEMRGLETIAAAINQAVTDEDLALALQGLGLYWTTSGPPVDKDGNETNWRLGPGQVVEIDAESTFNRVTGVSGLPALQHIGYLAGAMQQASGVSDVAAGRVNVQVAESGIALYLELAPIIAKNAEKESEMLGVHDHMLYDLVQMWFPVYEGLPAETAVEVVSVVDDPMPVDRDARIKEILSLVAASIISSAYAREELTKLGYEFPAEMGVDIVQEKTALSAAMFPDPYQSRAEQEIADIAAGIAQ